MFDPMPDELAIGHGNRLAILNGQGKISNLIPILHGKFQQHGVDIPGFSTLDLLANAVGMSTPAYTVEHSMLPVLRVTAQPGNEFIHGSCEGIRLNRRLGMLIPRKFSCVCSICINEDLEKYGYSYYRRSHHLNGVDWCPKHGEVLKRVNSEKPFTNFPHVWHREKRVEPLATCSHHIDETPELVRRYSEISLTFLKQSKPQTVTIANGRINLRA